MLIPAPRGMFAAVNEEQWRWMGRTGFAFVDYLEHEPIPSPSLACGSMAIRHPCCLRRCSTSQTNVRRPRKCSVS